MRFVILFAFVGFLASILFSFIIFPKIQSPLNLKVDPDNFLEMAFNIYNGQVFKYPISDTFAKGPVYPCLLTFLILLTGEINVGAVQVLQAIIHALSSILIYFLAREFIEYKKAIIVQLIYLFHPVMIWYTSRVWIETIFTFFIIINCYLYIKFYQNPIWSYAALSGIATALGNLTKSVLLLYPLIFIFLMYKKWKLPVLKKLMLMIFFIVLVMFPWLYRNYSLTGKIVLAQTTLGYNLILGDVLAENWSNSPLRNLDSWNIGDQKSRNILAKTNYWRYDVDGNKILIEESVRRNIKDPKFLIKRFFVNFISFWYLSESALKSIFIALIQIPLLIIVMIGIRKIYRTYNDSIVVISLIGYFSLLHSFIIGWARYSVPIIPLIILLFVIYICNLKLWDRLIFRKIF